MVKRITPISFSYFNDLDNILATVRDENDNDIKVLQLKKEDIATISEEINTINKLLHNKASKKTQDNNVSGSVEISRKMYNEFLLQTKENKYLKSKLNVTQSFLRDEYGDKKARLINRLLSFYLKTGNFRRDITWLLLIVSIILLILLIIR